MVARHDRNKVHRGRRKQGSRKRRKAWLRRNKMRVKNALNRKQRRANYLRRVKYRRKSASKYRRN